VELHEAMDTIWHVSPPPGRAHAATVMHLIRDRFYSFVTVLGIGFLLLVSLVLNAWMAAMKIAVPWAAGFVILYLVIAVLFAALYKILPDVKLKWSDVALGAMIARIAVCDRQAVHGVVLRACHLRDVQRCRLADCRVAMGILLGAAFLLGRRVQQGVPEDRSIPKRAATLKAPEAAPVESRKISRRRGS